MLTNLAQLLEPSVIQNAETAARVEHAHSAAWAHVARECGNLQYVKDVLVKVNRDWLVQCAFDQLTEIADRKRAKDSSSNLYHRGRYQAG